MTLYALYANGTMIRVYTGPFVLARFESLPDGWEIEEFWGEVSRGCISLEEIKCRATAEANDHVIT